jgi:uncharacterized protein DUF3987
VQNFFQLVDEDWCSNRVKGGLASGEGLIWEVRDPLERKGTRNRVRTDDLIPAEVEQIDPGVADKRLLLRETEFAAVLKVAKREGNTLSPVLRLAWDGSVLQTLAKSSPAKASNAHISLIGHITPDELRRHLADTEIANGLGNRFLWVLSKRSKYLPFDPLDEDSPVLGKVTRALRDVQQNKQFRLNEEATVLWEELYPELSDGRPGMVGELLARATAQVTRIACTYAALDQSFVISQKNLLAALALWLYVCDSVEYIFGTQLGDPDADAILAELRKRPDGMTRTEISKNVFGGNISATHISRALRLLEQRRLARSEERKSAGVGRPGEIWFVVGSASTQFGDD